MRLRFLGPGRVLDDAGEVILGSGNLLAIVAYLHMARAPVAREHLATLFWPGRDRSLALQGLRQALSRLRSAMGEDAIRSEGRQLILATGPHIRCDVDELRDQIRDGDVDGALDLWGGHFLEEFRQPDSWEVEDWLERERVSLSRTLLAAVEEAGDARLAQGAFASALSLAEAAGIRFPNSDELTLLRGRALVGLGRWAEAAGVVSELGKMDAEDAADALAAELEVARVSAPAAISGPANPPEPSPTSALAPAPALASAPSQTSTPRTTAPTGATGGPVRRSWLRGLLFSMVGVLVVMAALGFWRTDDAHLLDALADGLEDRMILYCSPVATQGQIDQLFRMDYRGLNKQRISTGPGCVAGWMDSVARADGTGQMGALLRAGAAQDIDRYFIATPHPENPLTEWVERELESVRHLSNTGFYRYGSYTLDGRYALLTGIDPSGQWGLHVVDVVADSTWILTHEVERNAYPTFDVSRREVIFSSQALEGPGLYAIPFQEPGATPVRLTESPSEDTRTGVHGHQVVFVRGWGTGETEGDMEILLLDRESGALEALVSRPWNDYEPRWSPDGRFVCFQSEEFGHYESQVQVVEVATKRIWSVTPESSGRNAACWWSHDSQGLFFHSGIDGGPPQTFFADREGRERRNLTRLPLEALSLLEVPKAFGR